MAKNNLVYLVIFPNTKVYVGKTSDLARRRRSHKHSSKYVKSDSRKFYRAINKYGYKSLKWEVLCKELSLKDANYIETAFIRLFKSTEHEYGYNISLGGDGGPISEETKKLISVANKGRKRSEVSKAKMSRSHLGVKLSKKHVQAQIKGRTGSIVKEETRLKISKSKGSRPFVVYKGNEYIGKFVNQKECARLLGLKHNNVNACLNNRAKSHKGYTFRFYGAQKNKTNKGRFFTVYKYHKLIGKFDSPAVCARKLDLPIAKIQLCLNKNQITWHYKEYTFHYDNKVGKLFDKPKVFYLYDEGTLVLKDSIAEKIYMFLGISKSHFYRAVREGLPILRRYIVKKK